METEKLLEKPARNYGMDLVRAAEAAAIAAGRWMGLGKKQEADRAATEAMVEEFKKLDIDGHVVVGESGKSELSSLDQGVRVGSGHGASLDVVVDPIDGSNLVAQGRPGAISVVGIGPRGSMWTPPHATYMEKIVVDHEVADALVPECMDAPAAWTLALVSRVKRKPVRDLVVFVLDRARHQQLIEEIRTAGARVMLRIDGDIAGALLAASAYHDNVDVLMGIGGVAEGVIAACAVKALRGAMLVRLAPQSEHEREIIEQEHGDLKQILTCDQLATSSKVFFAATGITEGPLVAGVSYKGAEIRTESIVLRGETSTRRTIRANHMVGTAEVSL